MTDRRLGVVDDVEVDMRSLFGALGRALPWLIVLAILFAGGMFALLTVVPPSYKAETKVLIESGESTITKDATGGQDTTLLDAEGIASQVQLIESRDLASSVVTSLDLGTLHEFNKPSLYPPLAALLSRIGLARPPTEGADQELVLKRFGEKLDAFSVDKTRVITIDFSSVDPALAAKIANEVANEYLTLERDAKRSIDADATRWLESQIGDLRTKVTAAEAKVEAFRSKSDLFSGGQNNTSLSQQKLTDLNTELARLQAARSTAEANAATVRAGLASGAAFDAPQVLDSQLIQRLREQQVALRAQIAQLSATLLPQHPRLKELNAQLADLDSQIRREANRVLASLEGEAASAKAREMEINGALTNAKSDTAQSNDAEVQLRALEREATAERDLLETYLRRYREADSRQNGDYQPADARIISRAAVPLDPAFPKRLPMTAAATIALLLLAIAVVLMRELMSGRAIRRVVVSEAPLPTIRAPVAETPVHAETVSNVHRLMPAEPTLLRGTAWPEEPEALTAMVDRLLAGNAQRILVATAESDDVGRPLAAVSVARSIGRRGLRVLLIDLQSDGADQKAMTMTTDGPGFAELFAGASSFGDVIFRDRRSRAHLIGRGGPALDLDATADRRLEDIFAALDQTYDHLVIDAELSLAIAVAPAAQAIVVAGEGADDPQTLRVHDVLKAVSSVEIMLLAAEPPPVAAATAA